MRRLSGFHAIEELLKTGKAEGRLLVSGSGPRIKTILELAKKAGVSVVKTAPAELDRLAPENRGVAFETEREEAPGEASLDESLAELEGRETALILVLDHIEDPQNFGALIRSADVFACDLVIAPKRRAAPLSEAAARASAGALAHVPVALVANLGEALRRLEEAGFWRYAADMDGDSLPKADLPKKLALVMGNEGAGVSRLLRDECDGALSIPQSGHVDSLNVSAAGAVFMYEYRRRWPAK
ncbi:MAG: 23S rRNA (guanosine(2251)-2'-O)-methyltransferase RlmB [Spirochaetaceae bacterium]|nr:23S rRNA (guanosine(2251)-2'-O)-methyltransferase RlmB [Spirochaetaceae bacterium]